jgi:hypothetical protein
VAIDPRQVALFIPPGLKKFKLDLFERIGKHILELGGSVVRHDYAAIGKLPDDVIPIVGCTPQFREFIRAWRHRGRTWIYWDRGYLRRVFATSLATGNEMGIAGGYYRWHVNSFQMNEVRSVPGDRLEFVLKKHGPKDPGIEVKPWRENPNGHIVVADTGEDYWDLHAHRGWSRDIAKYLAGRTTRKIIVRDKEQVRVRPLVEELRGAHALVTHGSVAAVEAAIVGCPVFVSPDSAARHVGLTDFSKIESPVYPDRTEWLKSIAYCQFNERELCDGTLWNLIE